MSCQKKTKVTVETVHVSVCFQKELVLGLGKLTLYMILEKVSTFLKIVLIPSSSLILD